MLNNRTYLGELRHKEQWVPAAHPPIIERGLWDRVHAILTIRCRVCGGATQAVVPFLLKGIVFGNDGRALSPWHFTKKSNGAAIGTTSRCAIPRSRRERPVRHACRR